MTPAFTTKGSRQHRYYVTRLKPGEDRKGAWRVPAGEIDRVVLSCLRTLSRRSVEQLGGVETPFASDLAQLSVPEQRRIFLENHVEVELSTSAIRVRIEGETKDEVQIPARLMKRGNELKLVLTADQPEPQNADPVLLKLLVHASAAQRAALTGAVDPLVSKYSKRHFWQLLRVSWLAPDIIAAIAEGRQPATLTGRRLLRVIDVPLAWDEQRRLLSFN